MVILSWIMVRRRRRRRRRQRGGALPLLAIPAAIAAGKALGLGALGGAGTWAAQKILGSGGGKKKRRRVQKRRSR